MLHELTPKQIVAYLDEYIIGQTNAKKAIAIALRNRYRRLLLEGDMVDEVMPKNILMIGSTGVVSSKNVQQYLAWPLIPDARI